MGIEAKLTDHQRKVFEKYLNGEVTKNEYTKTHGWPPTEHNHYWHNGEKTRYKPELLAERGGYVLVLTVDSDGTRVLWNEDVYKGAVITRKARTFNDIDALRILVDEAMGTTYYYVIPKKKEEGEN